MKIKFHVLISHIIYVLLFFTLGAIFTIFIKKTPPLTISNELYLPDIVMIIITLMLSLYISCILEKSNSNERIEKDLIITYIKEYYLFLKEKINIIQENNYDITKINSNFKIIRMRFYKLKTIAHENKLIDSNNKLFSETFDEITKLWAIFTNGNDIRDIKIEEDIELTLIKIEGLIYEITIAVNDI